MLKNAFHGHCEYGGKSKLALLSPAKAVFNIPYQAYPSQSILILISDSDPMMDLLMIIKKFVLCLDPLIKHCTLLKNSVWVQQHFSIPNVCAVLVQLLDSPLMLEMVLQYLRSAQQHEPWS